MAKRQTFGDKMGRGKEIGMSVKLVFSRKNEEKNSYSFVEKIVNVPEGEDMIKKATEAAK